MEPPEIIGLLPRNLMLEEEHGFLQRYELPSSQGVSLLDLEFKGLHKVRLEVSHLRAKLLCLSNPRLMYLEVLHALVVHHDNLLRLLELLFQIP